MTTPVRAWQQKVFIAPESAWGEPPIPTAAMAMEVVSFDMGPAEQGVVRPRRDKSTTRGMQRGFVEGRVEPIAFSGDLSILSRAAAATPPPVIADVLKAAGFVETVGANVAYALSNAPTLQSLAILSALGDDFAEHGRGGVVKQLSFSGGDSELTMRMAGAFIGKNHLGRSTGTLQDAADTSLVLDTPAEAYRIGLGYYSIGAEVVKVTAIDVDTGTATVVRAQAGTVAAAHNAAALFPYTPAFAVAGAPISEAEVTVTFDGDATFRATRFSIDLTTGMDHLPGESGSAYVQGGKVVRYDVAPSLDLVLTRSQVALLGKVKARKEVAVSILCGSAAGGRVQFSLPYCELQPFAIPAPSNDISTISIPLRCRDDAAGGALSVIFS